VLEGAGVRVAALLDPQVRQPDLASEALGPEQIRAALEHADDVLVGDLGKDHLLPAPDARSVRPLRRVDARVEELLPGVAAGPGEARLVVRDLEQLTALPASVDDLEDVVLLPAGRIDALEPAPIFHPEPLSTRSPLRENGLRDDGGRSGTGS